MNQSFLYDFVKSLNSEFIGPALVFILLGAGLFFTIRLKFIPRFYFSAIRMLFAKNKGHEKATKQNGMSPIQALSTAIASQVGTGNIVGVAMALLMGGPGALFWLWASALLGMSTNFAEAILGQLYKTRTADGHIVGGPAFYIHQGLHSKWLARIFSVFFIMALGMIGIMVQANSISDAITSIFPNTINPIYVGIVLTIFVGLVLSGGITRIASFTESIVPLMAGIFILGSIVFICMRIDKLGFVLEEVFRYAFTPKAGVGGAVGISVMSAVRYGVSRGLFSNEAGLGTTPHAHAIAKVNNCYEQGLIAIIGIGVDLTICTLTGLVLLLSGVLDSGNNLVGIRIMQSAFDSGFGVAGNYFIAISLFFFAMSTIVGWYFFAAQNVRYLFGERPIIAYRIIVMILVVVASVVKVELVWELADTFNFFIVVPNIIALIWLSPKVVAERDKMKKELDRLKALRREAKSES
ncbi:MAG: alanine/glycine:cation symporter family protein [Prevotella sp.]|jgi:AGCS family alanine or glycine:cation symporter